MGIPCAKPGTLWLAAALAAALAGPASAEAPAPAEAPPAAEAPAPAVAPPAAEAPAPAVAPPAAEAPAPDPCAPWPGEPDPLPQLADADPVRARWAELRAAELADRAAALEGADPLEAHRLWLRFRCFDPGSPELRRALDRTRPVRVHRPEVERAGAGQKPELALGWQVLDQPLLFARPAARPSPAEAERRLRLGEADRWIGAAEAGVRGARFDDALESAGQARSRLAQMPQRADLQARWIRLELAEATAHVARGHDADAIACAERALAHQPGLDLDASRYSPKLVRLFQSARAGRP